MATRKVLIRNLMGIKQLDFDIPSKPGVYFLVGPNGCGKSTLLTCLDRIKNGNAFRLDFPATREDARINPYANAKITYETNAGSVSYTKGPDRWNPQPRTKCHILNTFGFSSSVYVRADGSRLSTSPRDIDNWRFVTAPTFVKNTLCEIFSNDKFKNLVRLQTANRGRPPQDVPYLIKEKDGYYSERRFSAGEIALIRLIEKLDGINSNGLILLDEAELALHPRVQRNLVDLLEREAKSKQLIVIIATHSTTLISHANARRIILLDNDRGIVQVTTPCYPAMAIQGIDLYGSVLGDYLVLVEDEMAKECLRFMCEQAVVKRGFGREAFNPIVPAGTYLGIAKLAVELQKQVPPHTSVRAVVDHDAFESSNDVFLDLADRNRGSIIDLGFTPEVLLMDLLESNLHDFERYTTATFSVNIRDVLDSRKYKEISSNTYKNPRDKAKALLNCIVEELAVVQYHDRESECRSKAVSGLMAYYDQDKAFKTVQRIFKK